MSPTPKKFKRPDNAPLPKPNVEFATAADAGHMTPEKLQGMICNPIYTGIGSHPAIIDDEQWVRNAMRIVETEGAAQFLVNMLYVLRKSFDAAAPESDEE